MLNLVRKTNGSARHLQTSAQSLALVQKHSNHLQPPPVAASAQVKKGKGKEHDALPKLVKHGALRYFNFILP